ncbi:MAG: class I SAM-dependent methyltransferase [candidate division Zixibacteria bacterium]|nr:class I SAM-dependent methyltransferase [candidate division Zixibacteria bacterium]
MKQNRLYGDLAWLWPLLSPPEDYAGEAKYWRETLREKLGPGRHHILELGVGGGHNLSHLTSDFKFTAVDRSREMLAHSIKLNPDVEHKRADMRKVRLDRKFNAVIIHDAISYMLTENDLLKTFRTAAAHLDKGGIFVTSPDYLTETFSDPSIHHNTRTHDETELTYVEYTYDPDPKDSKIETIMTYYIREKDDLRIEQDLHISGLFPMETWRRLFERAGFIFEAVDYPVHEDKRQGYLFVGVLGG